VSSGHLSDAPSIMNGTILLKTEPFSSKFRVLVRKLKSGIAENLEISLDKRAKIV
jgi:hypothetical protein